MQIKTRSFIGGVALLCSSLVQAEWSLDNEASSFYYVTSKASAVSEINSFTELSGTISDQGAATLVIDLNSVDTLLEVRDERMRNIVFQVEEYPEATVSLTIDAAALDAMAAGSSSSADYSATVNLRGMDVAVDATLQLLKLDEDTVQVQLGKPLLVGAASFGLTDAVEELRELAALPAINPNVVLDFTLVYNRQ